MQLNFDLTKIEGFNWDEGNIDKNEIKHSVTQKECEEMFFNEPLRVFDDEVHSKREKRYGALGKINKRRYLTVFFTLRGNKIRIISARDQSKNDRKTYREVEKQFKEVNKNL